jgi:gluconokinase
MSDGGRRQPPVLVIMGVSGCGKSTIAGILASKLGWDLEEGDDLHPSENIEKMAAGHPLTDDDRWPWLDTVASWIFEHILAGTPGIITCSALKKKYRDVLRQRNVTFVHLTGSKEQIARQLTGRIDHYMPPSLLDSQIATLEPPEWDENSLLVEVGRKPTEEAGEIISRLRLLPVSPSPTR